MKIKTNKLKRVAALILSSVIVLNTGCGVVVDDQSAVSENEASISENSAIEVDFSAIRAQDDFYGYINAETLLNTEVKYGSSYAGSFMDAQTIVDDRIDEIINDIISSDEEYEVGSEEYIIKAVYENYINTADDDTVNEEIKKIVYSEAEAIMSIDSIDGIIAEQAKLMRTYGVQTLFNIGVSTDYLISGEYAIFLPQVTSICGQDFKSVEESVYSAKNIENMISNTLRAIDYDKETADDIANDAVYMLLNVIWSTDYEVMESLNPESTLEFYTVSEMEELLTNISYSDLEKANGIKSNPYGGCYIQDKNQIIAMDAIYTEENLESLKAVLLCQFISSYGEYIREDSDVLKYYFPVSYESIEDRAERYVKFALRSEISNLYIERYYTEEMDEAVRSLCEDIRGGYRELIANADWLTEESRANLLVKLENMVFVTGINAYMDITPAEILADDIFTFEINLNEYNFDQSVSNIGTQYDKNVAGMYMTEVNACYNPDNTITITAAIMNEPFFSLDNDYYANLGGLGMVIGHEMGHGFDSNCIVWDMDGNYNPEWLSASDIEALEERNQEAIRYFEDNFTVFDVYHINGEKTLGENYADLGSMECITSLCNTDEELMILFEEYALIWSEISVDSSVISLINTDVHSPAIIRVNAILSTTDAFYEVYDVKEGDGMYIAPELRIHRW